MYGLTGTQVARIKITLNLLCKRYGRTGTKEARIRITLNLLCKRYGRTGTKEARIRIPLNLQCKRYGLTGTHDIRIGRFETEQGEGLPQFSVKYFTTKPVQHTLYFTEHANLSRTVKSIPTISENANPNIQKCSQSVSRSVSQSVSQLDS